MRLVLRPCCGNAGASCGRERASGRSSAAHSRAGSRRCPPSSARSAVVAESRIGLADRPRARWSSTLALLIRWRRRSASRIRGPVLVVGVGELRHGDVRLDAAFLHRTARGRVIARGGEAQRRVVGRSAASSAPIPCRSCARPSRARGDGPAARRRRSRPPRPCPASTSTTTGSAVRRVSPGAGIIALDVALLAAALRDDLAVRRGRRRRPRSPGRAARPDWSAGRRHSRAACRRAPCRSPAIAALHVGARVWAEKVLMLMMPTPSLTSHFTGCELDDLARQGDVERLVAAGADDGER